MAKKKIQGECLECESSYQIEFQTQLTSKDTPMFCPFCGEEIEDYNEELIDEESVDNSDNQEWD